MRLQLDFAERFMRAGKVVGLIFLCPPSVDFGLESVRMAKDWILRHGEDMWGA